MEQITPEQIDTLLLRYATLLKESLTIDKEDRELKLKKQKNHYNLVGIREEIRNLKIELN